MSYKNYENNKINNTSFIVDEERSDRNEKKIKDNILLIKKNMIYAEENLENLKNNLISKRIIEALHEEIQQIYVKVVETEHLFREWEIRFAENPFEKQKKKYIFEKLNIHFKNEVNKLENISINVKKAANELPNIENGEMNYNNNNNNMNGLLNNKKKGNHKFISSDDTIINNNFVLDLDKTYVNNDDFIESSTLYDYEFDQCSENDLLIENEIINDKYEGIKKIQGQVAQAQEVFKDLANLVFTQKENIEMLNNNLYDTKVNTFKSAKELKKTYDNVKQQRFSWFLAVVTLIIFIYFLYFKIFHFSLFS
ncbi:syntaxin, Qa-SNARE family [Plasmodium sp. gorilla clade G2]|uniref:syntaxin, Qa-SNARE family n=1 Tax=Plasmodium sp. gorilla clade G2 TaxID=880535 RepID=UPI000D21C782|nr:syntaxin, Qa-SNARE family [Plasmodium sp. gorilla clade G2]SOV16626.1 syntaxin, Qa-SNARE family [Plasmodium sp. gorilla clade G2]